MRKDEPGYERWYARHRIVENDRVNRLKAMENPVIVLDDDARGPLPETYSLEEMYWHQSDCQCGSCINKELKRVIKGLAAKDGARSISPSSPVPPLHDQTLRRLQDASAEVLSKEDAQPLSPTEPESQP